MSCTLYWRPVKGGRYIGDSQLRDAIMAEFGLPCQLGPGARPFLRGLAAAGMEGAQELIAAIEKHETVEMYLEC